MTNASTNFNLLLILVTELTRHKLRVLLFIAVIVSALAVILSSHHNRQQNIALEQLMRQKDDLDVEWRNLVLEQRALTEHNRIEALVEKHLDMQRPGVDDEVVVRIK
ncbi:MAG: cell division protein FtsL [Pseudomonadota bacterium]|jgi:cell division protein FtsL|uniref:Cell division protein FtsL n=1 Tax=Marisediminitalea aggregata TaxID=634436 RepID=A0A1M5LLJ0_9ALTE|nr:cell division protein FtsL [Marisediminitalea aggregata]MAX41815.1 cell division protein FtsL [Alteromonadaceae bacterium]MCP3861805.1 cell division protein FtsL [Aestuariibacter sp.]MEC7468277.1 cell division protein FtsL [Pseudomonadota bacterium]BBO26702.1 cell division protein FtsL [Alteromonas sp. I4]HBY38060.1 cell division protein FtsL [Alteromonas sp.]|tara:strand:- start:58 stop:378 length:321 start_codon:yes stop_codon:yes gene_type:complete